VADINEKVVVDTKQAVENLDDLKSASQKADEWLDRVIEQARNADGEKVDIPVETPGAKQAADDLDAVDTSARRAADGAKVGTQHVSDLAGMFGNAGGAASQFGQAIEGAGGIVESFTGQLGLSEDAAGKLNTAIGGFAIAVAAGAAAWQIWKQDADNAKKGAQELRDALGQVYDKLREGDRQAAAQTFVDTMSDKIKGLQELIGHGVSQADIAGSMFGDPNSIDRVTTAISKMDDSTRYLAQNTVPQLQAAWSNAKAEVDNNIALESRVESFFGGVSNAADGAAGSVDGLTAAFDRLGNRVPAGAQGAYDAAVAKYGAGNVSIGTNPYAMQVTNNYPPANTPLAVEQAQTRFGTTQGYQY
jgi:hypothetical protein